MKQRPLCYLIASSLTCCAPTAIASFDLVADFEGLSVGAVNNQGGWNANDSSVNVVSTGWSGSTTQALENGNSATGAAVGLPSSLPNGSVGTLYFEFKTTSLTPGQSFGVGDSTALSSFNDYGAQLALNASGQFVAAGGSSPSATLDQGSSLATNTVYSVWMVIDNSTDTWSGYIQGGAFSTQTQLTSGSQTSFIFRDGGATGTQSAFIFRRGSGTANSLSIDNVHFDASGSNLSVPSTSISGPPAGNWTLEFEDNFDGSTLDGSKWRFGSHYAGIVGSGGLNPEAVTIADGKFKITADQGSMSFSGSNYGFSTGEITTFGEFSQKHGYFEARVKYDDSVSGLWPAFWLMPDRGEYGYGNGYSRAFVKFDLQNESIGSVTSASLKLTVESKAGSGSNVLVLRVGDDSWEEDTITWNNMPEHDPLWIKQLWSVPQTAGQEVTVDVTDYVQAEVSDDGVVSFHLADKFMQATYIRFHSREATTQAYRPRLVINGQTYYATEDARVSWGTNADTNYGDGVRYAIVDSYGGDTAHTFGGGMEVDILETWTNWGEDIIQHAAHWDGYGSSHQYKDWGPVSFPATSDGFHTYGLYWDEGLFEFYIDGIKTAEWNDTRILSEPAFMLLTLQIGGPGNPSGTYTDGKSMEIDFVRVWSGTKTGGSSPGASLYAEAEHYDNTSGFAPLIVSTNTGASNGEFIQVDPTTSTVPNGMPNPGYADYEFDVDETMTIDVWVRARAANDGSVVGANDSFWIDILGDYQSSINWNGVINSTSWKWYQVSSQILEAGSYTLRVGYRENGSQFDQVYITGAWDEP